MGHWYRQGGKQRAGAFRCIKPNLSYVKMSYTRSVSLCGDVGTGKVGSKEQVCSAIHSQT